MSKSTFYLSGIVLIMCVLTGFMSCLGPLGFDPNDLLDTVTININIVNDQAAALELTNKSKTVDVKKVTITGTPAPGDALGSSISFENQPKRLTKKVQYLAPTDQDYTVVINYDFFFRDDPSILEGSGTKTITVQLPFSRMITEVFIFRDKDGNVVLVDNEGKNVEADNSNPVPDIDKNDTGNAVEDTKIGEGSSPAIIPPGNRDKMATFVVISKTSSQAVDSVNFRMGEANYTMGRINVNDKQSIALGQGTWATRLTYTRDGNTITLGPINSIVVPSNDPQAILEHYLYFYLNKKDDYAISPTWPPANNDAKEEDILPVDSGYGRGLVRIINNSYAMANSVSIHNLRDADKYPLVVNYNNFTPPVPVQYNKTGYVDIVGTSTFPIEAHGDYLIQVTMKTNSGTVIVERRAYIKDQIVTIEIGPNDIQIDSARGTKVTLENQTSVWPVRITGLIIRNRATAWQSSYFGTGTWQPAGVIAPNRSTVQYVMSTTSMPITPGAQFEALVTMFANGISETVTKDILPSPVLYSENPPDQNVRTITITDADVPQSIKDADYSRGAKFILENQVSSWPVEIIGLTVRNKNNTMESTYYGASTWEPHIMIGNGQNAAQMVMGSRAMPITPGAEFEAFIVLHGSGETETIRKAISPAELFSSLAPELNTRTITITDSDVPQSIKDAYIYTRGATFTVENRVNSWPVQIIGMTIQNRSNNGENTFYNSTTWEPRNIIGTSQSAVQLVKSSPAMPIRPGVQFEAVLTLFGNGQTVTKTMAIDPAVLYSTDTPSRNTRTITITDTDVPDEIKTPPQPTALIGAKVILENAISSWPVQIMGMTVRNKTLPSQYSAYSAYTWSPNGMIDRSGRAEQMVYSSPAMPIASGGRFEAVITLHMGGIAATVVKDFSRPELYSTTPDQNLRTITLTDSDVPPSIKDAYIYTRGARVTIQNQVSTKHPVQITGMRVQNRANTNQNMSYNSTTWEPGAIISNSGSAVQMVMSCPAMPIRPGVQFEAVLTLVGNGKTATITMPISPAVLYSDLEPTQNNRTITITDSDIPTDLQTPPPYETDIPGLDGSTSIGDTVTIDGFPWYVADKKDVGGKTYVMLVCKIVMENAVVYNDPRDSNYDGSMLQVKMTELYNRMNEMKKIAVLPNLGDHSENYLTQPTPIMAGSTIRDVFFALTYRDVGILGEQAWRYGSTHYWTRSPVTLETAWEVSPSGKIIGEVVTNATAIGAVPSVWVRTE